MIDLSDYTDIESDLAKKTKKNWKKRRDNLKDFEYNVIDLSDYTDIESDLAKKTERNVVIIWGILNTM